MKRFVVGCLLGILFLLMVPSAARAVIAVGTDQLDERWCNPQLNRDCQIIAQPRTGHVSGDYGVQALISPASGTAGNARVNSVHVFLNNNYVVEVGWAQKYWMDYLCQFRAYMNNGAYNHLWISCPTETPLYYGIKWNPSISRFVWSTQGVWTGFPDAGFNKGVPSTLVERESPSDSFAESPTFDNLRYVSSADGLWHPWDFPWCVQDIDPAYEAVPIHAQKWQVLPGGGGCGL